jgi:ligand-binding sensor protein
MGVYDIKSQSEWQEILDRVCGRLGMPAALLDENNAILQHSGSRNPLCLRIRDRKESKSAICGQSQQYMAETAWSGRRPVIEACEAGLAKIVLPLFHGGRRAGTLTACGACSKGEEVEGFFIEKSTGLGEEALAKLAAEVPEVDPALLEETVKALSRELGSEGPPEGLASPQGSA